MPEEKQEKPKEKIQLTPITEEMQKAYLDYAMSVIVSRALPDVRDGLKPVQRRIIYAMHEQGMTPGGKYSKCAAVVGEVLKKYHPHGDLPVYDALVRLAQSFSLRYPLIDGQGNFGSIDGDPPAAMRYTECKLSPISLELLSDIEKETVIFAPNYDASTAEPVLLPSAFPNLLVNGTSGIAVGMATSIPPHHIGEVIDALKFMIEKVRIQPNQAKGWSASGGNQTTKQPNNKELLTAETPIQMDFPVTVEDLIQYIPGPDFPTAALVYNQEEIAKAYATGKGSVLMRAKAEIIEEKGKMKIVATQLPYQVNKAILLTKIAELVKGGKIKGISAIRDESDREGIRVVVELKKDARPQAVLNYLYKHTQLQETFHANMVALINGQPKVFTLKGILEEFLKHRFTLVVKRTHFLLKEARHKEHILQGLKIALDHLDEVIETIKRSRDTDHARARLMEKFTLSEIQAQAILDMPLKRLSALEREKIEQELKDILAAIKRLETLLSSPQNIFKEIGNELSKTKEKFSDERRTKIFKKKIGEFSEEELVAEEEVVVMLTQGGYIKRLPIDAYRRQRRGGTGVMGMKTKEEDVVNLIFTASTHDGLLIFTNKGRVYKQKVFEIPEAGRAAKGTAIVNLLDLAQDEMVSVILPMSKNRETWPKYLFMATNKGTVKKTETSQFENIRRTGIMAIRLKPGDDLTWVKPTSGENDIVLVTADGKSIRFSERDVRSMGRSAAGVRGIKVAKGASVIGMEVIKDSKNYLLIVSENGFGKKTPLSQYRHQGRGGSGILTAKFTQKTGRVVAAMLGDPQTSKDLLLTSAQGQVIRLPLKQVSTLSRATQGVTLMRLHEGDKVVSVAEVEEEEAVGKEEQSGK